ncbi:MAG: ribosome biogenesis GTPase Der [Candidatus Sumerlaeales bacterium]|nr:ribosome biogenesis GTPase Der [Candidatus Sumerlaeales bacterium]
MTEKNYLVGHNIPIVALVGRPNVGKSTLFNRITGTQKAVVHNTPGLTRDRNYGKASWLGREFLLIDTGGYELDDNEPILKHMREQTMLAVDEADVIVFLTDIREPNNPNDDVIIEILRRTAKPVIIAVNKCDNEMLKAQTTAEYARFGSHKICGLSATQSLGTGDLLDEVVNALPETGSVSEDYDMGIRVAVVGRPNVGKSTLVNSILGFDRCVASSIAGTTRDAVDTTFVRDGRTYTIIDTAGIRRRGKVKVGVEKMTVTAAVMSLERCDIALIVVDAVQGLTEQDAHVAGYAVDNGCGCIIVVNKWDALEKDHHTADEFAKNIRYEWGFLKYVPMIFVSALTGQRVVKLFGMIDKVYDEYTKQIDTSVLNEWLQATILKLSPPIHSGRQLKIKYAVQVASAPPTVALFVNDPKLIHFSYERYLMNQFRESFGFEGVGVRFVLRAKSTKS